MTRQIQIFDYISKTLFSHIISRSIPEHVSNVATRSITTQIRFAWCQCNASEYRFVAAIPRDRHRNDHHKKRTVSSQTATQMHALLFYKLSTNMGTSRRKKVFGIGWTWQKKALNTELTYLSTAAIQKKI